MDNRPSENQHRVHRYSRRPILAVVATVFALHPVNLPPVKLDIHLTVGSRQSAEWRSAEKEGERK